MTSQTASGTTAAKIRTPRLERGKARVAALLNAAAAVFAEKGYDAATMTEIAAAAGAPIGSLYQFFPTKELLAAALHSEMLDRLSGILNELRTEASQLSPGDLADRLLERMAEFLTAHPAFIALADGRSISKEQRLATRTHLRDQIASLLQQTQPPLSLQRSRIMALVILQMMKTALALSAEDEAVRSAVLLELRLMLRTRLDNVHTA